LQGLLGLRERWERRELLVAQEAQELPDKLGRQEEREIQELPVSADRSELQE
jgi:hypothetical protein